MNGNSNNLIIGSYFSEKFVDPKKEIFIPKNDYNVIKSLYSKNRPFRWNSVDIRIFHDGLDKEFISRYSKKWIKFIYYNSLEIEMGPKDTLLMLALDFIKENPQWENIFIIDTINVKCITNPFQQIIDNPNCIFLANNEKRLANSSMFFSKLENINEIVNPKCLGNRPELTGDIIGGDRNTLIPFLEKIKDLLIRLHDSFMVANHGGFSILHTSIAINFASLSQNDILTDKPLFASNKHYQINGNLNNSLMFTYK
jgi:hypothetical protein